MIYAIAEILGQITIYGIIIYFIYKKIKNRNKEDIWEETSHV